MTVPGAEKPVVVLVHGAWHRPLHYLNLILHLQRAGHTVVAPTLPSTGYKPEVRTASMQDAVDVVRAAFQPHIDAGKEVILVGHSFGGFSVSESAVGETVEDRKSRGQKGGIKRVVFLTAYVVPFAGASVVDAAGFGVPADFGPIEWWKLEDGMLVLTDKAPKTLYKNLDDSLVDVCMSGLVPQTASSSFGPPLKHASKEINADKAYILCEEDPVFAAAQQQAWAEAAEATVIRFKGDHCPFIEPEGAAQVADLIVGVTGTRL